MMMTFPNSTIVPSVGNLNTDEQKGPGKLFYSIDEIIPFKSVKLQFLKLLRRKYVLIFHLVIIWFLKLDFRTTFPIKTFFSLLKEGQNQGC